MPPTVAVIFFNAFSTYFLKSNCKRALELVNSTDAECALADKITGDRG
ncbi:MAG: hypothetical protein LBJ94_03900 [Puniceicoccales bacterium]|nr:hypothetical protein [Puniceicoccales bacterium]